MNDTENDLAVDDSALFNSLTGGDAASVPEITSEPSPAAAATTETPPATTEPAIPPSRLREEADARRAAERERDELRGRLSALETPAQAAEPAKPKDMWEDPKAFTAGVVSEALTPVQEQMRNIVFTYSKREAVREFGAETITAAETAMKDALEAGQLDKTQIAARLSASLDPVGDVVRWHKQQSAIARVGNDPDAFVKAEIERMLTDPARKAELQQMLQGGAAPAGQQQNSAPVTELPTRSSVTSIPSIRNLGQSAAPAAAASEPSDDELFHSVTSRRRG